MERLHSEAMANKEQELSAQIKQAVVCPGFHFCGNLRSVHLNISYLDIGVSQAICTNALCLPQEQCREELLQSAQEREQQASLALEEAELQKAAVQSEGENKAKELQLELESARTVSLYAILSEDTSTGYPYCSWMAKLSHITTKSA